MNRRHMIRVAGSMVIGVLGVRRGGAQSEPVELEEVSLSDVTPSAATPTSPGNRYEGDLLDLWEAPINIGSDLVEIGVTIMQRFEGTSERGFALGLDGVVAQSVIYGYYDFQRYVYIGITSDLRALGTSKTVIATGTYGGVHESTDTLWQTPILLAHDVNVPE